MAFSLVTEQAQTVLDLGEFVNFPNPYMVGNPIIIEDGSNISIDIPPTDLHIIYKNENHEFREDFVQWNGGTFTLSGKKIVYSMYGLDNTEELAFRLVWDGVGYPWDGVSGEEVTVVGEIRPLQKVLRVDGAHTHIYRLDEGAKLTFPDAPAGTLEVTKTENNIITTTQTSFSGGTLELTDREILDAKIVDEDGNTLFQLGKKVGDSVFDVVEPTRIGTVEGNVSNVKDVGWGMVFDGAGDYINFPDINIGLSDFSMGGTWRSDGLKNAYPILGYNGTDAIQFRVYYAQLGTRVWNGQTYEGWNCSGNISSRELSGIFIADRGSEGKVYVYGREVISCDISTRETEDIILVGKIGYNSWMIPHFFTGVIRELFVFLRALSFSEISLLTQGRYDEVSKEELVLWVTVDPKTGDIIDRSPYRHTVTPHGGVETKLVALA